ncbi:hypothetical protein GT348_02410 [Aristophania vespae]|uniref:Hemolysin n=1 Tax=Aristophania vespae TaxID=2697033 RepID=A0A6P1NEI3_9PROT|nr:hypothetical protein [Aristophania vespae]QHI95277.1 hypothetical protein GT348_02410 [Aristophania vespae]UMM64531.1 hypothetical protein DM15PD_15470 [Aristophania vespae]
MRLSPKHILWSLCLASILAGCSHTQPQNRRVTQQSFAPDMVASSGISSTNRTKYNLPSAPVTTPLCGNALHEQAQTGEKIYGQSLMSGNNCALNACFQPLTGTYISESGNPTVCR